MLSTMYDGSIPKEHRLLHVVGSIKSIMKLKMIEEYNKHYGWCGQMTSYSHILGFLTGLSSGGGMSFFISWIHL